VQRCKTFRLYIFQALHTICNLLDNLHSFDCLRVFDVFDMFYCIGGWDRVRNLNSTTFWETVWWLLIWT
jgi:hypothetical protein